MDELEQEFIKEGLDLLGEYKLLGPDNEYGWDSWKERAERLILRQRLYEFLKVKEAFMIALMPYLFSNKSKKSE